ncbi:hypothetical protein, partial [Pseudomonas sp. PICF141]|uniref:hypothetical protein n=1 Tax=Pseudomonas sp. PICF141 TaxID=1949067 RepID=UPI001C46B85B
MSEVKEAEEPVPSTELWRTTLSDENPVGAWLAPEECIAVFSGLRVIVLRGQAPLPQVMRLTWQ